MGCNLTKEVSPHVVEERSHTKQEQLSNEARNRMEQEAMETSEDWLKGDDPGEIAAVTKIQAAFRGHQVRKKMTTEQDGEPTREQLEAEFRADDTELCHAATKIQATFRGHMSRAKQTKDDDTTSQDTEQPASKADAEEELDIDLTDPELHKAATKIQASFRGHKVRKDEPNAE